MAKFKFDVFKLGVFKLISRRIFSNIFQHYFFLLDFPRYNITKDEITGNVDLIISDVQFDDDGRYECQVRPNFRVGAQITVASRQRG